MLIGQRTLDARIRAFFRRDSNDKSASAGGISGLALFASTGTLICCALPILLASLGAGAAVVALTSQFPFLIPLSQQKEWVFGGSALLLGLAIWRVRVAGRTCPTDPELARRCRRMQSWNRGVLAFSAVIWGVGFFAAYLLLPLALWLEGG